MKLKLIFLFITMIIIKNIQSSVLTKPKNRILNVESKNSLKNNRNMNQKIRRIHLPHQINKNSKDYVKKHGRHTEDEDLGGGFEDDFGEGNDWSESDDFIPDDEEEEDVEYLGEYSEATPGPIGDSASERRRREEKEAQQFPQDPEQFEDRQEFIMMIVAKFDEALKSSEHVLQIEIDRNDIQDAKIMLEGYHELRDYNQTVAVDSMNEEEDEEEDELDYEADEAEAPEDTEENPEGTEEDELFNEEDQEEEGIDVQEEALHVAEGEEHLTGEGENGEENWDILEEQIEQDENQEPMTEEEVLNQHDAQDQEPHHEETQPEELHTEEESEEEKGFITYDKLPDLLLVVEGLLKTFNEIFTDFPKEPQTHDPEAVEAELEKSYNRINEFITRIYNHKEPIDSEMKYLIDHINLIKFSKLEVLNFYHFQHLYEEMESEVLDDDENWNQKNSVLDIEVNEFINHVKEIEKDLNDVESSQLMIWNETDFIKKQLESENALTINDKISGLPSLIQKLLNIKFDIDLYLNQISLKMKIIRNQKKQFKETMVDMRAYVGVDGQSLRRNKSSEVFVYSSMIILIIALFKFD